MPNNPSIDDVDILDMGEEDLDDILVIEKQSFAAPWSRRLFGETMAFSLSINLVMRKKIDKTLVGYANFYLIRNEVQILNIAVAPDARKQGYGAAFLSYVIGMLTAREAEEFFLEVRESNTGAIRLYERLGFMRIGKRKGYYCETNEDAIVMRLKAGHGTNS